MKIAFTGHRPDKLGGYNNQTNKRSEILDKVKNILKVYNNCEIITGMALGIDQWVAELAIELNIPFHAHLPFRGQEKLWPNESQKHYEYLLSKANTITIVSEGSYSSSKMQIRNKVMVDNCDILIAIWDGTSGGTKNCIEYAKGKKPIIFINI